MCIIIIIIENVHTHSSERCVADNKVSENGTCVTPIPPATINLNVTLRCRRFVHHTDCATPDHCMSFVSHRIASSIFETYRSCITNSLYDATYQQNRQPYIYECNERAKSAAQLFTGMRLEIVMPVRYLPHFTTHYTIYTHLNTRRVFQIEQSISLSTKYHYTTVICSMCKFM